jgi:cytochrome c biogenesis factor
MENTSRHVFGLNGITGMLIATVLLLLILGTLTFFGLKAQQAVANKPYKITDPQALQMRDAANANQKVIAK